MDNLYDHLDNYDDEIKFDELKKENNDLRMKLVECTLAMENLQKDFNHLSSEFKKLEKNYSSLLKTAKEEIKRKTTMITQLNIEKDAIVLNAIQNRHSHKVIRSITKPKNIGQKMDKEILNKDCKKEEHHEKQNERQEPNCLLSVDTITSNESISTGINRFSKTSEKYSKKETDFKENIFNTDKSNICTDISNSKPLTIKNRRKSMPAIRCDPKFSSDEEFEDTFDSNRRHTAVYHERDINSNKNHNNVLHKKNIDERLLTSETSSMDDKYSNYHDSKDHRYKRSHYHESERNRHKEQNAPTRFVRQYSPDRNRHSRNYPNDYNNRQEYNRKRVFESPPPDKFHYHLRSHEPRSHEPRRHEPRSHEPRSHEPRRYNREEYRDYDRNRERYQDRYTVKHKLSHDNEEPSCKRRRNDSSHYTNEDKRKENDSLSIQIASPTVIELPCISCQSPDYEDISTPQPIKEIKSIAVTKLEDPRLQSKFYIYDKSNDILSTVVGRNFDLKVLTNQDWNIESVAIPKALRRRPSQCSDDENIWLDAEIAASDISEKCDEILSSVTIDKSISDNKLKGCGKLTSDKSEVVKDIENTSKINMKNNDRNIEHKSKDSTVRNRNVEVLKTKHSSETNLLSSKPDAVKDIENISDTNLKYDSINIEQKSTVLTIRNNTFKLSQAILPREQNLLFDNTANDNVEKIQTDENIIKLVAGDLELSDDTCDVTEVTIRDLKEPKEQSFLDVKKTPEKVIVGNVLISSEKNINKEVLNNKERVCLDKKLKESIGNTQKPKKRSQKTSKKAQPLLKTEKKTKTKNDSKEIKTKFCELFGDSSSLITPEDLGIDIMPENNESSHKAIIPPSEDAQDAVDLKDTNIENESNCLIPIKVSGVDNMPSNIAIKDTTPSKVNISDRLEIKLGTHQNTNTNAKIDCDSLNVVGKQARTDDNVSNGVKIRDLKNASTNPPETVAENNILIKHDGLLKAFATSTPHKEFSLNECANLPQKTVQVDNNDVTHDSDQTVEQSSVNNTLDSHTEADAPDVRIFVKRRRKIIKKPKP